MDGTHCEKPYTHARILNRDATSGVESSAERRSPLLRVATDKDYTDAVEWIGPDYPRGKVIAAVRKWATESGVDLKHQKLYDMVAHAVRDATDSDYDEAVRAIRANPGYGQAARIQKEFSERGIILEKNRLYRAVIAPTVETPAAHPQSAFIPRPAVRSGPGRPSLLSPMAMDFLRFCIGSSQCMGNSVPDGIDKELMRIVCYTYIVFVAS